MDDGTLAVKFCRDEENFVCAAAGYLFSYRIATVGSFFVFFFNVFSLLGVAEGSGGRRLSCPYRLYYPIGATMHAYFEMGNIWCRIVSGLLFKLPIP